MTPHSLESWAAVLDATARTGLTGTPLEGGSAAPSAEDATRFLEGFSDEYGHRRPVDRPLLARLLGISPGSRPASPRSDEALWWALHDGALTPPLAGEGPLAMGLRGEGVEIWTEAELASLHAAFHHAFRAPAGSAAREAWLTRVRSAAAFLVAELQPDNGTNHPWATHVFAWIAQTDADGTLAVDARMYAQTLVHNSLVARGAPDRFSAVILLDGAAALRRIAGSGTRGPTP